LPKKKGSPEIEELEFEDAYEINVVLDIISQEIPEAREFVKRAEEEEKQLTLFEEELWELFESGDLWWSVIPSKPEEEEGGE